MSRIMVILIIALLVILVVIKYYDNKGVPIFLYHHIDVNYGVDPADFEEHLKILQQYHMNTITMSEYLSGNLPQNAMAITFDDGYSDNYHMAYRLLQKYHMKATIFLNTAYIGVNPDYLTWDEVREMYNSGYVDFQAHTHTHGSVPVYPLVEIEDDNGKKQYKMRGEYSIAGAKIDENGVREYTHEEYEARVRKDFEQNKRLIEENIGNSVKFFCWPMGHRSKEAIKILQEYGIIGFVSTKKGTNSYKPNWEFIKRVELRKFTPEKFKLNLIICKNLLLGNIYRFFS